MRWLLWIAAGAILYQALVLLVVRLGWRNPRAKNERDPSSLGLTFETVRFPTAGGKSLHGWWIPSDNGEAAPVLVLVHGWGRNAARMLPYIQMLHPAGYDLLAFDARHHGESDTDGYASMPKFSEDIRAAVDEVRRRRPEIQGVGVLGLSVGGSAAIHAAAHDERIQAVATVGAFATPADPRATLGRWWWILGPGLPLAFRMVERRIGLHFRDIAPERHIGRTSARFLLIHGAADSVIPLSHARRLEAAAAGRARLWLLPGRGHSDPHREPGMAAALAEFFHP
ncbi:MAG: alpha/beta hydrolase [Acidobacteriota bacterium]